MTTRSCLRSARKNSNEGWWLSPPFNSAITIELSTASAMGRKFDRAAQPLYPLLDTLARQLFFLGAKDGARTLLINDTISL